MKRIYLKDDGEERVVWHENLLIFKIPLSFQPECNPLIFQTFWTERTQALKEIGIKKSEFVART